jgi:formylglycine-generating enzyme required for sulfatase activity
MNTCTLRVLGALVAIAVALATSANASAPTGRYVVTNGGTASGTVYDTKTELTWQQAIPSTTYTWADAKTYCAGVGASLGGTGWRLPTCKELQTIVDDSRTNPAIDPNAFPSTPSAWFWSSSPVAGSSSGAWLVSSFYGFTYGSAFPYPSFVRCVR